MHSHFFFCSDQGLDGLGGDKGDDGDAGQPVSLLFLNCIKIMQITLE